MLQEVEHLMQLPAQIHRMVQDGVPWWQIMYTGIMSTDAVLMIEVCYAQTDTVPEDHLMQKLPLCCCSPNALGIRSLYLLVRSPFRTLICILQRICF